MLRDNEPGAPAEKIPGDGLLRRGEAEGIALAALRELFLRDALACGRVPLHRVRAIAFAPALLTVDL